MSRAFVVKLRNDIADSALRALDLQPNSSLLNPSYVSARGQTSVLCADLSNAPLVLEDIGAGSMRTVGDCYGIRGFLVDHIAVDGEALNVVQVETLVAALLNKVTSQQPLTGIDFYFMVLDALGPVDLEGSLGSIETVLRILSGEVYKLPANTIVSTAGNVFTGVVSGFFVTRPNVLRTSLSGSGGQSVGAAPLFSSKVASQDAVTGRFLGAGVTLTVPSTADLNFRDIQLIVDTPDLHRSCAQGALSVLKSSTFLFNNPSFVYGGGGTAKKLTGAAIPSSGVQAYRSPAIVVYSALGDLI